MPLRIRLIALLIILNTTGIVQAQQKGLVPADKTFQSGGRTRALVIGISRYEHVDTLSYAHRDAEIFAGYLNKDPSWNVLPNDIVLLTNDRAKRGTILTELQRLALLSKPGDQLVFYFSGHGDVETITMFNKGYLLAYDTYSNNYLAGAIPVNDLRDVFMTLTNNQVKVIVITDACRSGKLAGGAKGMEYTAASLKSLWSNEIKILSSQPGQLSQEGPQWGGGRGVFSYYLVQGLEGAADNNHDSLITLAELESYVGNVVSSSTKNDQQPIIDGPNKYSTVIASFKRKLAPRPSPMRPGGRIAVNDSCSYYEKMVEEGITQKRFNVKDSASAIAYYRKFRGCSPGRDQLITANSRLLAALMNETQEIVNRSFIGNSLVSPEELADGESWLAQVIELNDIKLANTEHLRNLQRYLEAIRSANWGKREDLPRLSKMIDSAVKAEPEAAYLLMAKGVIESRKGNRSSAIRILESAVKQSPNWLMPKYYLGTSYGQNKNYEKALGFFEEILRRDSSMKTFECVKCILAKMTEYAFGLDHVDRALSYFDKSMSLFPEYYHPYDILYEYAIDNKNQRVAERLINRLNEQRDSVSMQLFRLRFESEFYKKPIPRDALDSLKALVRSDADQADYSYTLATILSEGPGKDLDSAYTLFYAAARLDPKDINYVTGLLNVVTQWGAYEEVAEIIEDFVDEYEGDEKAVLQYYLLEAYLTLDQKEEAWRVAVDLLRSGYFECNDLKKMKKYFSSLEAYKLFMRDCD